MSELLQECDSKTPKLEEDFFDPFAFARRYHVLDPSVIGQSCARR
jgi:hypothetical protein